MDAFLQFGNEMQRSVKKDDQCAAILLIFCKLQEGLLPFRDIVCGV